MTTPQKTKICCHRFRESIRKVQTFRTGKPAIIILIDYPYVTQDYWERFDHKGVCDNYEALKESWREYIIEIHRKCKEENINCIVTTLAKW